MPRLLFDDPALLRLTARLERLVETEGESNAYVDALGTVVAHELLSFEAARSAFERRAKGGLAPWQQRVVTAYIEEHLAEPIMLRTLAQLAGLSRYHFCRAFKQSLGTPPRQYQCHRRIEHAKRMLARSTSSVTEVGLTVGYSETSSFTAAFHKTTGLTPTGYRRSLPVLRTSEEVVS